MPLSEKAQATRLRILEAGMRLFHRHGYNATGLDKIIKAAGVTKGNFYYYFKSKEALALESLDLQLEQRLKDLNKKVLHRSDSALETLLDLLSFISSAQKSQYNKGYICGCYFGNFTLELSTASTTIRDKVKSIFQQYIGLVESLLIKAKEAGEIPTHIDPAALSPVIISLIEGSILLDKADQSPQNMDNSIRFIQQVLSP